MKKSIFKRVLSFVLALAMVITMSSVSSLGQIIAYAADNTYKLYFELPEGTRVSDWAVNAWDGVTVTGDSANAFRPTAWGAGDNLPTLLADEALTGWGYVTITGTVSGVQFVDIDGNEFKCWNNEIAKNNIATAYFDPATSKWYKEAAKTNEIKAAEVQNVFYVAGQAGLVGADWKNTAAEGKMTQSSEDANKFSITFKNVEAGTYEYKILQDPENKGWDLPFGGADNRTIEVPYLSNVTLTIDISDSEKTVKADFEKLEETPATELAVSDQVKLVIADKTYDMDLFLNGVFESAVDLKAGEHNAAVTVNGKEIATDSVKVEADGTVYFRFVKGTLKDSINDKLVHTATLVGNFTGLDLVDAEGKDMAIASWNPEDTNGDMTYLGGGIYKRTFTFKKLEAELEIKDGGYKVAFDHAWDYSIGDGSGNIALKIPAGADKLTVFVDEINKVVYDSVRTADFVTHHNGDVETERASFNTTVTIAGDVNGWSGETGKGYDFTQISDKLFVNKASYKKGTYQYKCVFNGTDWFENGGNKSFDVAADDTDVVIVYNAAEDKLYDSINDAGSLSVLLGMAEAPAEMKVSDNKNGTTTFVATGKADQSVILYYGNKSDVAKKGADALTKVDLGKIKKDSVSSDAIFFGDDELDIVYYYEIDGTKTLDSSNATVKVGNVEFSNYKRGKFEGRTVNVAGTFPGPSWDASSNVMTYQGNGLYTYTFKNVPAANYEYKIAFVTWAENYGEGGKQDGSNYSVAVPEAQDVTIYYTDLNTHLSVTSLNYKFVDVYVEGTGIEKTQLKDDGLTGIYSAKLALKAGTYNDAKLTADGQVVNSFEEFKLDSGKEVTFYYAPSYNISYNDATVWTADEKAVKYDTKSTEYKSIYGAVPTGENVKISIAADDKVTAAKLIVKMNDTTTYDLVKGNDGKWSVDVKFDKIGEYRYFFVLYSGSAVKVYCDDAAGDYGVGVVTDLGSIQPYDIVVYDKSFKTPDWMKNAVIYQIFPDRFCNGDTANDKAQLGSRGETDYEFVDWSVLPENPEQEELLSEDVYKATGAFWGDKNWSNEMYGGDLKGITKRVNYLKALGVTVIYLNPVFASISSHRYDTSDYSKIDPILGTLGDFEELATVAKQNGMKIVLDGVFNHVSDDSIYFDRYYKYLTASNFDGKLGAYPYWAYVYDLMAADTALTKEAAEAQAKEYFQTNYKVTDFSYTTWFDIFTTSLKGSDDKAVTDGIGLRAGKPVYGYDGWWGYDSMPVIKSTNGSEYQTESWAKEIIGKADANGNYANNGSIAQYWLSKGSNGWRLDVANEVSDETWQNFRKSVKALDSDAVIIGEIWDDATQYLEGDMYDSVMNYVFRNAVLGFAKGGAAEDSMATLEKIRERYPQEAFYAMMNLVGSHDTTRVLSYLDGIDDDRNQKDIDSTFPTYEKTSDLAKKRQYLVALLQFTYAGAPTIYYGDEAGLVGADDPDDRRAFEWGKGNKELVNYYAKLAAIRSQYAALRTGSVAPIATNATNVMGFVRADAADKLVVLTNNSKDAVKIKVSLADFGVEAGQYTDLLTGAVVNVADAAEIEVPGLSGLILTTNVKAVTVDEKNLKVAYDPNGEVVDSKPEEQKPADQKPEEQKPVDQKPEDQKPEEQKPADQNKPAKVTLKTGDKITVSKNTYVVTSAKNKTVKFVKTSSKSAALTVPSTVKAKDGKTYKVTAISSKALKDNKKVTSLTIGSNVKTIYSQAFYGCKNLKAVKIKSKSITSIGSKAFKNVNKNVTFKIPKSKKKAYTKLIKKAGAPTKAKYKTF